ncbi:PepSY-associated TM helix domain-containing protein [uncultured Sphingomonas sp.]|uniref:PepSY-associated TM helix domain-containing protein n=1 Tax=uncultured Sphingomonas sp. TaxID=158754 RepID=UPI0025CE23AA|nr:PepSY-associated TM helix domain-containing protein [uncultured Sphingomonas sp.]
MSAVREGARQVMAWLHGWTGLLLGWVLFVMCLGGTLSVFKPEIGRWMRPETTATADRAAALTAATGWLATNAPNSFGWYLTLPNDRMNTVEATYDPGSGFVYRALDPITGAPVPRETLGGEFFYRLHFELQLPFPWGRLLASLAAMVLLLGLITGIIAHRRIFKDFFTFRPAKGQRSWLDGHNALGVLPLPFHIMISFTGLLTLATLNMPWAISANYGRDMTAMFQAFQPGQVDRPAAGKPAPLAPLAPMLHEAERRLGQPVGRVTIAHPGDAASVVTMFRDDARQIAYAAGAVSFDGATSRVIADFTENRPALQTYSVAYGLHLARFAPLATRWLYFLCGAMLTLAVASGMVLWVVKRRERAPRSLGNRIVERLNAGVLAGLPIGCVALLLANRVVPLGLADRAQAEVFMALWSAAGVLLLAALLPAKHSWPVLLTLLALASLTAGLPGGAFADSVQTGVSLTLLAGAAASGWLAWTQWRRPAPAPRRRARIQRA